MYTIKDLEHLNGMFIINIKKSLCKERKIDPRIVARGNNFCEWWQELEDSHEISVNRPWASYVIKTYSLTDDDITIYRHRPVKIKVEVGKCECCGRGRSKSKTVIVERICPYTQRARLKSGGWYESKDYTILEQ